MKLIKIACSVVLFLEICQVSAQDHEVDAFRQDPFYKSLIDRKEISMVYSQQGLILSDWVINFDGSKVFSLYRLNNHTFSKGTPILFLDANNLQVDSITVNNWPQDGYPWAFPVLSIFEGEIGYQPRSIYPDKLKFPDLKKMSNGFIKIGRKDSSLLTYELLSISKRFKNESITFNEKREEFFVKESKLKFPSRSSLIRFNNDKTLLVDKDVLDFYFFNSENEIKSVFGKISISKEDKLVNIDIVDENSFLLVFRKSNDNRNYISYFDINKREIKNLYHSKYFLPRAKSLGKDVFFELAGRFEDATFPESIILKLSSVLE